MVLGSIVDRFIIGTFGAILLTASTLASAQSDPWHAAVALADTPPHTKVIGYQSRAASVPLSVAISHAVIGGAQPDVQVPWPPTELFNCTLSSSPVADPGQCPVLFNCIYTCISFDDQWEATVQIPDTPQQVCAPAKYAVPITSD